jgi:hypothetical protein
MMLDIGENMPFSLENPKLNKEKKAYYKNNIGV